MWLIQLPALQASVRFSSIVIFGAVPTAGFWNNLPTSALDPELTQEVLKVIQRLSRENRTMIVVTHKIPFAREVSDQIIFMDDGVIAEQGTPAQVIDNPSRERTRAFLENLRSF